MESVWGGGRDLGVALGRVEPARRDGRIVVEVDQVVGHAGVARLALEDRLEDGRPLELLRVGLVIGGCGGAQGERVADLRLVVAGIAPASAAIAAR